MHTPKPGITLVVFTCEGRERLLEATLRSFRANCDYPFTRRIAAIDGGCAPETLQTCSFDLVLQQPRRGYVASISNALRQIEAEFFFWLEDDWSFNAPVLLHVLAEQLGQHPSWTQVRLSKTGPLTGEERVEHLFGDTYKSVVGFSANPGLCRTSAVRDGFAALAAGPHGRTLGVDGFENVLSAWSADVGLTNAVLDGSGVQHTGYLESTPRQWHMTASLDGEVAQHLFSMGDVPPLWRRIAMMPKLALRCGAVAMRQLYDLRSYELAFRIVATPLRSRDR